LSNNTKINIMKKALVFTAAFMLLSSFAFSQGNDHIKKPTLGIQFFLNDFETAASIRNTSLNATIRDKTYAKFKDMNAGMAISYLQGITSKLDFSSMLGASFVDYPMDDRAAFGNQNLLVEATASLHAKMLPDSYCVVPYLSAGVGASAYKGFIGAFMPLGAGIQVNLFDEAFLFINSQYRIKITEASNYHFFGSIGIAGNLDLIKKK
jgi:OOP family OmpA-OmpF porin